MSQLIPTGNGTTPFFDLQVVLDEVTYTLEFRWNERLGAWFMSMFDAQGTTPLMVGKRLVVNFIIGKYDTGRPIGGMFIAYDTSGAGLDPAFEDLGSRVQLIYATAADLGL